MKHRKIQHLSSIKICRNLPDCEFKEDCYYVHPESMETDEHPTTEDTEEPKINCWVCKDKFHTKHDLMMHKKANHPSQIICRDFLKSTCRRTP